MEFTKLLKYGSASLFLVLLAHGLILGFTTPTTIISIVLLLVCFLMEQKLVLHEREEFNTKIQEILTSHKKDYRTTTDGYATALNNIQDKHDLEMKEIQKKLDAINSQMNIVKTAQGLQKRF